MTLTLGGPGWPADNRTKEGPRAASCWASAMERDRETRGASAVVVGGHTVTSHCPSPIFFLVGSPH